MFTLATSRTQGPALGLGIVVLDKSVSSDRLFRIISMSRVEKFMFMLQSFASVTEVSLLTAVPRASRAPLFERLPPTSFRTVTGLT